MTPAEINRAVAEKVMGWKRVGKGWHTKPAHRPSKDFPGTILNNWDDKGEHDFLKGPDGRYVAFCGCEDAGEVPDYCTSIAYAFLVVEKLREKKIPLSISHVLHMKDNSWEYVAKAEFLGSDRIEFQIHSSAAMAICLAALEAVGVEVKGA